MKSHFDSFYMRDDSEERIIYSTLVKFTSLDRIFKYTYPYNDRNFHFGRINLFIDLTSMVRPLYMRSDIIDIEGVLSAIANNIINYRHYFNKFNIVSTLFVIFSTNNSINNIRYLGEYNSKEIEARTRHEVDDTLFNIINLLKSLIQYFPGVYLKEGTVEPSVIAYHYMKNCCMNTPEGMNVPNVFITSSQYAAQIPRVINNKVLHSIIKSRHLVSKDPYVYEDNSYIVTPDRPLDIYLEHSKNSSNSSGILNNDKNYVGLFMILNGLKSRGIKSILDKYKSITVMNYMLQNYLDITPDNIYNSIVDTFGSAIVDKAEIESRYCALDIEYQDKLYSQMPESLETGFLKDLYNFDELNNVIQKMFPADKHINIEYL